MTSPVVSPLRTFRTLAGALMAAPVVIGVAVAFVVGGPGTSRTPPVWGYAVIVGFAVVMAVVVQAVGYRVPALPPGLDPAQTRGVSLRAFQQSMVLRFALSEAVAIVALALVFATQSDTPLPYVVGAVFAEALLLWHVWPGQRVVERVQAGLDRAGARSDLPRVLQGV